ncbi:o-succinylbenzoate synthase [Vibrio nitrifigilis]|uniref:o-succinylbenzoate synthase n=1 Tax=Vibrio nitrifigilis TaxID=2789781 RepID=A0ABS0GB64_9VIBR|nr:o-succinylbenzoate synthase [Vibrio nitrifigilis]MBF8999647.1 o-succinylbenzoate synthase [Vibrio nitrifigilis]
MRSAKLYRYTLPMDSGVILRDNRLKEREGFIVELCEQGNIGRGEIAPLPGFSQEGVEEAGALAKEQLELWLQGEALDYDALFPSVAFGLSMAELELAGELPVEGNYQAAPLCTGDPDDLLPALNAMTGEKVAKVKVGLYEPIRDGMLVNLFLESMPDLKLRLDANRSWTKEKAEKFAQYIAPSMRHRITFLEEPCRSPSDSISFAIDTGISIAWDETLQESVRNPEFRLGDLMGGKAIIIKPTLIGSIQRCISLINTAKEAKLQTVISSSIESSLGLNQLARLAHWQLPNEVPGLDTIGLFAEQLEVPWPGCSLPVAELNSQTIVWQAESQSL